MSTEDISTSSPLSAGECQRTMVHSPSEDITAFERLPDEIIEQILHLTDPSSFASLILLNRKWRAVSQQAHLYTYHLCRCPSYAAAHHTLPIPENDNNLPRLRRLFAREVKRNLFEAYLRPRETVINLLSTSISSSSAPGGEAFHFSLSPTGHYVLAYSSSRIHVIDVTSQEIKVERELKILRRPALTTITDDGSLLAVLSTDLQIDLYDMTQKPPKHTRVITLDQSPRTIALSPTGSVMAAAYDSGIEVSSLETELTSIEKRAVKCYAVDSLFFSKDGRQLVGTTSQSRNPSTVVLTAPYYDPASQLPEESISVLWTTSILFPNGSRDCSHAVLLPCPSDEEADWAFTYDRVFETFRAVRIDDLRNGTTYFTGPTANSTAVSKLLPSTLPAASGCGDLVAAGFQGSIWLYGVPEDLEAVRSFSNGASSNAESDPVTTASQIGLDRRNSAPSLRSGHRHEPSSTRIPQCQLLCDRFRNNFVEGRKVTSFTGVTSISWVNDSSFSLPGQKLVLVAPGMQGQSAECEVDGMDPVDGGRMCLLDFGHSTSDGEKSVITIEVGFNEPEVLEEEHRDMATEVAIVRRRTVAQKRVSRAHVTRAATTVARPASHPLPTFTETSPSFRVPLSSNATVVPVPSSTLNERTETTSIDEDQEAFDAPYSHTNPRSGTTLRRAATAAAMNRRLHPQSLVSEYIVYRRADGREEHPHESDADNWVPPPPPYSREPIPPLPDHIRRSILVENAKALQRAHTQRAPSLDFPGLDLDGLHRTRTTYTPAGDTRREQRHPFQRRLSDSTTPTRGCSIDDGPSRPITSPVSPDFDELYDVSPPGTPQPTPPRTDQIPRRPVGSGPSVLLMPSTTPTLAPAATLVEPVSPIPQPLESSGPEILDWDDAVPLDRGTPSPVSMLSPTRPTRERLDQEVPPRPNEDHRLTMPPSPAPEPVSTPEILERTPSNRSGAGEELQSLPKEAHRIQTEEVNTRRATVSSLDSSQSDMIMPSADQLARLNSRKGCPSERHLDDPLRRGSGSFSDARASGSRHSSGAILQGYIGSTPHFVQALWSGPPRAADGAHGSSASSNPPHPQSPTMESSAYMATSQSPDLSSASPRLSIATPTRHISLSPNPRSSMPRLETIQSETTNGEATSFSPGHFSLGRQPSRAKRTASKSIKDSKKKGWRQSMMKSKSRRGGGPVNYSGWADVQEEPPPLPTKESKGTKCVVM